MRSSTLSGVLMVIDFAIFMSVLIFMLNNHTVIKAFHFKNELSRNGFFPMLIDNDDDQIQKGGKNTESMANLK